MIIGSVAAVLLLAVILGFMQIKKNYGRKFKDIESELKFFKMEKEYQSEAMMVFGKNHEIVFANKSARDLFALNKEKRQYSLSKSLSLKPGSSDAMDFFETIEKRGNSSADNFSFKDVLLLVGNKKTKIDLYIDQSAWNIDQTITCIAEISAQNILVKNKSDGKIDFLTGLPSQFSSLAEINTLVIESQRRSEKFSLFLLGIDHFSDIQATLGQAYINQIVKSMANYFSENPDENRKVYRMDCDKFLLVVKQIEDNETARKAARKMIVDIENYYKGDINTRLTVSFGIARYPEHGENATKLIDHVYTALDRAQKDSISNIGLFQSEANVLHKDDTKMNEEIIKGLKNREFLLYYQPIFDLKSEDMIGAEALIRWNHPEMGLIAPDKFLEIAGKTGLIVDLGEYVFKEAMRQRKQWDELGFKKFKITLNLSLREMQVDQLIKKIDTLFDEYSVDPLDFNLDITEVDAMENIDKTSRDFKLFKELGLSLALDHFGAGYSSLKHLQALPLSMLKIDRSLIFDLSTNLDHQMAVKAIINMAHVLGYEVVAEGVETSKESAILHNLSCDHAQGYLFSRPLPVFEFQELLR